MDVNNIYYLIAKDDAELKDILLAVLERELQDHDDMAAEAQDYLDNGDLEHAVEALNNTAQDIYWDMNHDTICAFKQKGSWYKIDSSAFARLPFDKFDLNDLDCRPTKAEIQEAVNAAREDIINEAWLSSNFAEAIYRIEDPDEYALMTAKEIEL